MTNHLRLLLKINITFVWNENHEKSFLKLKKTLTSEPHIKVYGRYKNDLSIIENVLCHKSAIVIPEIFRKQVLKGLHAGHLGLNKTHEKTKTSVWWPNIKHCIEDLIKNCETCIKSQNQSFEPMISSDVPKRPWEQLAPIGLKLMVKRI